MSRSSVRGDCATASRYDARPVVEPGEERSRSRATPPALRRARSTCCAPHRPARSRRRSAPGSRSTCSSLRRRSTASTSCSSSSSTGLASLISLPGAQVELGLGGPAGSGVEREQVVHAGLPEEEDQVHRHAQGVPTGVVEEQVADTAYVLADAAVAPTAGALRREQQVAGSADAEQPVVGDVGDVPVALADVGSAELAALGLWLRRWFGAAIRRSAPSPPVGPVMRQPPAGTAAFQPPCSGSSGTGTIGLPPVSSIVRPARRAS